MKYRTWKFAIKKCTAWEGVKSDSSFKDFVYEDKGSSFVLTVFVIEENLYTFSTLFPFRSRLASAVLDTWNHLFDIFHCISTSNEIFPKCCLNHTALKSLQRRLLLSITSATSNFSPFRHCNQIVVIHSSFTYLFLMFSKEIGCILPLTLLIGRSQVAKTHFRYSGNFSYVCTTKTIHDLLVEVLVTVGSLLFTNCSRFKRKINKERKK